MKILTPNTAAGAVLFTLSALSGTAQAQGYFGMSYGQATIDDTVTQGGSSVAVDETATGWKVFGGYMFTDNLGLEGGWSNQGDMNEQGLADINQEGPYVAGVGAIPLGDSGFSILGRVGAYIWDQDIAVGANAGSHDGIDLMYGVGAKYLINDLIGVQLDWERYNAEVDAKMVSLGLTLNF